MKRFIQEAARTDILGQYQHYLNLGISEVAERFLVAVNEAIDAVVAMPDAGAPKHFENPQLEGLRTWPIKGFDEFRVYYITNPKTIIVVRILHGKRDVQSIMDEQGVDEEPQLQS